MRVRLELAWTWGCIVIYSSLYKTKVAGKTGKNAALVNGAMTARPLAEMCGLCRLSNETGSPASS
jgi:hypothetical protein